MKHLALLCGSLCAGALLAGSGGAEIAAVARPGDINQAAIDAYVTTRMRAAHIPGVALGIVDGDRIVYLRGYGAADRSGRPVTPQTPFLIGSVTKSFTALAVMQLVEDGKVELDAPVERYIPWFRVADPQASARITVRHLLTMTSGLPQIAETQLWTAEDDHAIERAVRLLDTVALSRPVGSFGYSNSNSETLGVIVQTVSGMSYEAYVTRHIFAPLDMHHSFLSQKEARLDGMASGYRWWFGTPVPFTLPDNRGELPAGFIESSAEDMSHFLIAQMNGGRYDGISVLSAQGIALTHAEPIPGTYAMGWESFQSNGRTVINHDGGTANFQASVFFEPQTRIGVFMAANAMSGLDAFSSWSGSSPLDGPTIRAMAESALCLATGQPLPSQGITHERLVLIFNLAILALSAAFVFSLTRISGWHDRLSRRGIATWTDLVRYVGWIAISRLALPVVLAYFRLNAAAWKEFVVMFLPDLSHWLDVVAVVLFLSGIYEIVLVWRVFRHRSDIRPSSRYETREDGGGVRFNSFS